VGRKVDDDDDEVGCIASQRHVSRVTVGGTVGGTDETLTRH